MSNGFRFSLKMYCASSFVIELACAFCAYMMIGQIRSAALTAVTMMLAGTSAPPRHRPLTVRPRSERRGKISRGRWLGRNGGCANLTRAASAQTEMGAVSVVTGNRCLGACPRTGECAPNLCDRGKESQAQSTKTQQEVLRRRAEAYAKTEQVEA
jgi:hypothetical protein